MESNFLNQFDNNNIVELKFRDQGSKQPLYWQLISNNSPNFSSFNEIKEVIKALLGFQPKPLQIKSLIYIKQGLDIIIIADIGSGKNLLF